MKKTITIVIIILLALGLGFYLFKISPQPQTQSNNNDFNLSDIQDVQEPRPVGAGDYVLGNKDAKNTAIVYEDFECPACATYSSIVEQMPQALQDTKVVFRHYPLPQHTNAIPAAYAAEAAGAQGKFWEMYQQLYANKNQWANLADPTGKFVQLAQATGVPDLNKFKSDMQSKIGKDKIQADMREAAGLKINATPTLYFNGKQLQLGSMDQVKAQAQSLYK